MTEEKLTLDECAHCVNQLNIDLQRQTDACRYFHQTKAHLHDLVHETKVDGSKRLPFITFHFPLTNSRGEPGVFKLDLNSLDPEELAHLEPLFDALTDATAHDFIVAWERLFKIVQLAQPQVATARHAKAADVV